MVNHPTPEQIEKLPKWAQEYIREINRERDTAVRELNNWCDSQTPSPFYIDESVCTGESQGPSRKIRFVEGRRMKVKWAGLHLSVFITDDRIEIQWETDDRAIGECALIPQSFQCVHLKAKDSLR